MGTDVAMGAQRRPETKPRHGAAIRRDDAYLDRLEFIRACFDLAPLNSHLAVVAGEPDLNAGHLEEAIDDTLPVIDWIAERLEAQASTMRRWNIEAAGRNEIILRDVERNRSRLERLKKASSNG